MRRPATSRWQRWRDEQVRSTRRLLALGVAVGLAVGLVGQLLVGGVDPEIRPLVRLAMVVPAGVFVAWWIIGPGLSLRRGSSAQAAPAPIDVAERLRRVESTFDAEQVPRVRRRRLRGSGSAGAEALGRSIRRPVPGEGQEQPEAYRPRRPQPPVEPRGNAG